MQKTVKLLLGTKNPGKIQEARAILGLRSLALDILTYKDVPFSEVDEDGDTYEENSLKKARVIHKQTGLPILSDDSGLEVDQLNGAPGVLSSRFAGPEASDEDNTKLLLNKLQGTEKRGARFVTVATLYFSSDSKYQTTGILKGHIAREGRGHSGFGYDPVFVPDGFDKTLAQLGSSKKNEISHRRSALVKMKQILRDILT